MNSDISVKALKGPERPINPQHQRKAVLEALRCVDEVVLFDATTPLEVVERLKPDVLTAGFGYRSDQIVGRELVEQRGGRVVVTCQGDARDEPSTTKIVRRFRAAEVAEICRMGANASVNPLEKLKLMADHFLSVKELPGDVVDLGTCRGGTAYILRRLAPDKRLHLFDTWQGTPYDDPLCHHKRGEWAASMEECQKLVGNGELTCYYPGVFPNSAFGLDEWDDHDYEDHDTVFCFVYVDMDTEQATRDAISFFWPRMVPGGKMVVDDWNWPPCAGVEKAVKEAFVGREAMMGTDHYLTVVPHLCTCIIEKRA